MLYRHTHKLRESTWIEIGFFELRAHRNISMATVMTSPTRNVMRYDHAIAHLEFRSARFHHPAGYFMTQDDGVFHSLKTNLVNIGEADSAGCDLEEHLALA